MHREKWLISLLPCGPYINGRKEQPMWDKLMKQVDVEEPRLLFDQVHLGCTKSECKQAEHEVRARKQSCSNL